MLIKNLEAKEHEQVLLGVTGSGKTFTLGQCNTKRFRNPPLSFPTTKRLPPSCIRNSVTFSRKMRSHILFRITIITSRRRISRPRTPILKKKRKLTKKSINYALQQQQILLTRKDTIIVASVSCIYNIGSPKEYGNFVLELKPGMKVEPRKSIFERLVQLQYERNDYGFHRSTFRVRGNSIDFFRHIWIHRSVFLWMKRVCLTGGN